MRKSILKLKITMTNISRIIMSLLFVNLGYLFQNNVQASMEPICYLAGPSTDAKLVSNSINLQKVFIIAVPIVLVIALVSFIIIKRNKSKKKENKEDVKKS